MSRAAITPVPADLEQRLQALDAGHSFIVQAPAGSGKTGLLTQRYLALLPKVEHPEEIVAITFTRKAAAEMRARILGALRAAREAKPDDDYQRQTWHLARAALARSDEQDWNVLDNPQRLRVRTIDSLCQLIGREMPVQSGFGEVAGVAEDAAYLHRAAAERTLEELESGGPVAGALATLLHAMDNRVDTLAGLISAMLARRDQWLQHVLQHGTRAETEQVLVTVIEQHLSRLGEGWESGLEARLLPLLRFAAGNLPDGDALTAFREAMALPSEGVDQLPVWQALAGLFLTRQGGWRAVLNKNQGFPADKKSPAREMKADALALLDDLREEDALRTMLAGVAHLPNPVYTDEEWVLIEALFVVLKQSVGHLRVVFAEQGLVDFTELSLRALEALGDELEPTELALKLDYRLRHLLVDEFQDSSQIQNQLFRRLTAGWQQGDGRTLFLVGDPMQSIYRFREADVGQFLDAWQGRLGGVELQPLRLTVNFRSDRGVIEWVNREFPRVLPENDDQQRGAVRYAASEPYKGAGLESPVQIHAYLGREDATEASRMLELIEAARRRGGTTAVLARSKAHLAELVEQLRGAGKRFQAVEIGALQHSPAVMDLASLTRALLHLGDRVAWLAVLHGPYCGLSLADLLVLGGEGHEAHGRALVDALFDLELRQCLSEDGQERMARFVPALERVLAERGRRPLHEWVESAWLAMGGPLTVTGSAAREDAEVYFQLLMRLASDGRDLTPERLDEEIQRLCALPDPEADSSLQLMSIHKAKGLEFDAVILPGLGKGARGDDPQLLYWLQTTGLGGQPELLFGPARQSDQKGHSSISEYIRMLEMEKAEYEAGRLLYVAATRARRELHLLGHARTNARGEVSPAPGSLLALLWPSVSSAWEGTEEAESRGAADLPGPVDIRRGAVPSEWVLPEPPPGVLARQPHPEAIGGEIPFEWAGETARAVGTVVHRLLQHSVESGKEFTGTGKAVSGPLSFQRQVIERMLQGEGLSAGELPEATRRVEHAMARIMSDSRGAWVLSGGQAESACELPLTAVIDGQVRHLVVDRTFVDEEGNRWVIDYKTGVHAGGSVAAFLDEEEKRYRAQLEAYAAAFRKLEDRPVRAALYFPLIDGGWRELEV